MHVDLRDRGLTKSLFFAGAYEPTFQKLAGAMDLRGRICIDVGANIGVHTLPLASLVGPAGRVFAFEPDNLNFALLKKNLAENGIMNVEAIQAAAGAAAGTGSLKRSDWNYGDHRLRSVRDGKGEIRIVPLDDVLETVAAGSVKFIKIDVQGYEAAVLRGARYTLARNPGAIVLLELSPALLREAGSSATELLQLLSELRLTGWEINDYRISPIAPPWLYERIVDSNEEYLLLSASEEAIHEVLERFYQVTIPQVTVAMDGVA